MNSLKGALVVLTGLVLVAVPGLGQAQIFDPFSGPLINPAIWHGSESSGESGTSSTETSRSTLDVVTIGPCATSRRSPWSLRLPPATACTVSYPGRSVRPIPPSLPVG